MSWPLQVALLPAPRRRLLQLQAQIRSPLAERDALLHGLRRLRDQRQQVWTLTPRLQSTRSCESLRSMRFRDSRFVVGHRLSKRACTRRQKPLMSAQVSSLKNETQDQTWLRAELTASRADTAI